LLLVFSADLGASASFYLLLSVVPLYAQLSGAGGGAAGLVTGALMLGTVAGELATPRLAARYGDRLVLAAGLLLVGAPSLALTATTGMATIAGVCLARGLGFGITMVEVGALSVSLIPPERRGEGLGLTGVVAGVPAVAALPLGVWLAARVGYQLVFAAAAVAALGALVAVPGLPGRRPARRVQPPRGRRSVPGQPAPGQPADVVAGLRHAALLRPAAVFMATTMAAGVVVTFLPLAVSPASGSLAAMALLAQPVASTLTRWLAGRHGDRHGQAGLLIAGLLAAAAGVLALALTSSPMAVIGGAVLFGAGFGVTQNVSLALMYARAPASAYGAVTALWSVAYDGGMGLGAAGFGVLAAGAGYPAAFAISAALMLPAVAPAWRDRRDSRAPSASRAGPVTSEGSSPAAAPPLAGPCGAVIT
jgi:MFS family permease